MTPIILHPFIFYLFIFFVGVIGFGLYYFIKFFINTITCDLIIFIDKSNRWFCRWEKRLSLKEKYIYDKKEYLLTDNSGLLNRKGKALYIFSVNKPSPMKISYNDSKWLSSESLRSILNNDLIQKLVSPVNSFKDSLILFGAVGGMIAGIASVLIMLKQFGIIK